MLKHYALFLLAFSFVLNAQNKADHLFDDLDRSTMQTDILFNQFLSSSGLTDDTKQSFTTNSFFQAYNELRAGDHQARFRPFIELRQAQVESHKTNIVPIGIVLAQFDILKTSALQDGSLSVVNDRLQITNIENASVYQIKEKLAAAPFRKQYKGLHVMYKISEDFFVNTFTSEIQKIEIDFGNGQGYMHVTVGDEVQITYQNSGIKTLSFKITLQDSSAFQSYSSIEIRTKPQTVQTRTINPGVNAITASISADLSAYDGNAGHPGQGEYELFLDTTDGVLDKPIILIDGFDPGDGRDIAGLYSLLDYTGSMGTQNLADFVRGQGFDVIIFNQPMYTNAGAELVDGGSDFIERNAMVLVELINLVNSCKVGDEQNVIIGPSMGGLISRYALNYMENQGLDHDTRLWLSFDSPHLGANVPLGMQHQFNYLAFGLGDNSVVELQDLVNAQLKSAAARQMLTDNYETHLLGGSDVEFDPAKLTPEAHPWRNTFMTSMNGLTTSGFPETTRNVSIINGSGIGNPYQDKLGGDIDPGFIVIDDIFDVAPLTTGELEVRFTPATASGSQLISSIKVVFTIVFPVTLYDATANAQAFSYSDGIDAAPGGLFDIGGLTDDLDLTGLTGDFVAALTTDFFNFIPSVSGMALDTDNGETNWFHDIDLGEGSPPGETFSPDDTINSTPFINWYMPDNNEPHVELTEANVTFALSEIIPETLSSPSEVLGHLTLERNPINSELVLLNTTHLQNAQLRITDLAGKQVFDTEVSLGNRTIIPVNLSSGLYILSVNSQDGFEKVFKLVAK